jgi:hypothetical protein
MDPLQQVNAGHYRAEALRIRREAATVKEAAIRSQLLEIATTYERIAANYEQLKGITEKQQVDAAHYRAVARRIRREAASMKDAAIRSQLLKIATTYEKLAESIEKQR